MRLLPKVKAFCVLFVLGVGSLLSATVASATDCNTNCHDRCRVKIPFGSVVEPGCHAQCEIEKKAACAAKTTIPHVPSTTEMVINPQQTCAAPFTALVSPIIAYCANYSGRAKDLNIIDDARARLISAGLVPKDAFGGVEIRWCDLSNGAGMTPEMNVVVLHPNLKSDRDGLASVLAHEMKHVEQYRRWGAESFKCRYSDQLLKGKGQGPGNSVEQEAYAAGDNAAAKLATLGNGNSLQTPQGSLSPVAPSNSFVTISDELGEGQEYERVEIIVDGEHAGTIEIGGNKKKDSIRVPIKGRTIADIKIFGKQRSRIDGQLKAGDVEGYDTISLKAGGRFELSQVRQESDKVVVRVKALD